MDSLVGSSPFNGGHCSATDWPPGVAGQQSTVSQVALHQGIDSLLGPLTGSPERVNACKHCSMLSAKLNWSPLSQTWEPFASKIGVSSCCCCWSPSAGLSMYGMDIQVLKRSGATLDGSLLFLPFKCFFIVCLANEMNDCRNAGKSTRTAKQKRVFLSTSFVPLSVITAN